MESYDASLDDLSKRIAQRRAQLDEQRRALQARREQVLRLLERIDKHASAFDAEDRELVLAQLRVYDQKLSEVQKLIAADEARRKERDQVFACMRAAIDQRTKILEDVDDCLHEHPEMLRFFARKQVSLQAMLRAKMEQSCLPAATQLQEQRLEFGSQPYSTQASQLPVT
jgi:chromosome segregation ATPase